MNEPTTTTPGTEAAPTPSATPAKSKGRPSRMTSQKAARESGPPKPRTLPFERGAKPSAKKAAGTDQPATAAATPKASKPSAATAAKGTGAATRTGAGTPKRPATTEAPKGTTKARGAAPKAGPRVSGAIPDFGPEFAPGSVVRVTYNHPGVGACTYGVRREEDGSFTLVEYAGARTSLVVGKTWTNAWLMLADLVGRPRHNVPLRRWFRLPPTRES